MSLLALHLEYGEESLLRYFHGADLLHTLFACLLFLQQLSLARNVTAVALGKHILAQRLDRFPRDDMRSDRRLNRHVEHLPRDQLAHFRYKFAPAVDTVVPVNHERQRIHPLAVDEDVELDHVRGAILLELVVERSIAARGRLELVEEIHHDL